MIESDRAIGRRSKPREDAAEGLLDAATRPLPPSLLHGLTPAQRTSVLLERLMAAAGADSGAVLIADADGQLSAVSTLGLDVSVEAVLPETLDAVPLGLTVREPELSSRETETATEPRMVLWLPLEAGDKLEGAIRLAFREFRSLEIADLQRLALIADHISLAAASAQRAETPRVEVQQAETRDDERDIMIDGRLARQDLDRLKGEFLAMISHELRTPLTAIIGYTDLLLRQIHGPLNERQSRHQEAVKKAAHRLLVLINDLLDVNRLESGHIVLHRETLSLTDAVRRATVQIEQTAEHRSVSLRLDLPASQVPVVADHERLHQILINLLDNAIKFTPPTGTVTVRVDHHGEAAAVDVIDTGVGVASEQLERIWDRFHQADSSVRRHFGGTGLGLAIVRHLVELHGGEVSVSSEGVGKGSIFSFTLPMADDEMPQPTDAGQPSSASHAVQGHKTILIVDDEHDNREVIRTFVQDALGFQALTASDGREALARVHPDVDLILLDLRMPGLSGFDVARELKSQDATAEIPILAITAVDDDKKLEAARASGFVGLVTKPFTHEELSAAIAAVFAAETGTAC